MAKLKAAQTTESSQQRRSAKCTALYCTVSLGACAKLLAGTFGSASKTHRAPVGCVAAHLCSDRYLSREGRGLRSPLLLSGQAEVRCSCTCRRAKPFRCTPRSIADPLKASTCMRLCCFGCVLALPMKTSCLEQHAAAQRHFHSTRARLPRHGNVGLKKNLQPYKRQRGKDGASR